MNIVPLAQLTSVWPEVRQWICDAIEYGQGDENELDVFMALAQARYALFHEPGKFAAVVQISQFPRQQVATIIYAGGPGSLEAMKQAIEDVKPWCRANGIAALRVWGRAGWEKVLKMKRKGVILQMELAS
jgi:hypothetical protein